MSDDLTDVTHLTGPAHPTDPVHPTDPAHPPAGPTGPTDTGLFGPDSVTWRIHAHPVMLVGGLRALFVQALHPHAMAGVAQHSDYRSDPDRRLRRTAEYVTTVTFGSRAEAEAAGALVRRVHTHIHGVDPITGRAYSAEDPDVLLWVHCVEVHSFLVAYRTYAGGLDDADQDRYLAEQVRAAELVGIDAADVPASRATMREYFAAMDTHLCVSQATRETAEFLLEPPSRLALAPLRPAWNVVVGAALGLVPRRLRRLYGYERPVALDALNRVALQLPVRMVDAALAVAPGDLWTARARWVARHHSFTAETPRVVARAG